MEFDNIYLNALYITLLIPAIVIVSGYIINVISNTITKGLASLIGVKAALFIRNRLTFAGTIHHELAHALFAVLTGAKVVKIQLFKLKGNELGSVKFYTRGNGIFKALQLTVSGIAPVVLGFCSLYGIWYAGCNLASSSLQYAILGYFFISILFHMNMSSQDVKNVIKGLPICMVLVYVIAIIVQFA